jgi:hypothetical protein
MSSTPSKAPVVFALLSLGLLQQLIGFGVSLLAEHLWNAPGALIRPNAWGATAAFIIVSGLLSGAFYNAAWLNLVGIAHLRARLRGAYWVGGLLAVLLFGIAAALTINNHKWTFVSYAQLALLVGTLAAGFRIEDAYAALNKKLPER